MQRDWAILHHDTDHAVVLKPAGMAVHGRGKHTLSAQVNRDSRFSASGPWQPIHRLDYGTRGPVMFARTQAAQKTLQAQWPQFTKPTMPGMRANGKHAAGIAAFPLEGKPHQPPSNALAQGLGECMVRLPSWSGPFKRVAPSNPKTRCGTRPPHRGGSRVRRGTIYKGHGLHLTCTSLAWMHPVTGTWMNVQATPPKNEARPSRHFCGQRPLPLA